VVERGGAVVHHLLTTAEAIVGGVNVYFVCVGNAGRSQMAEAFAERAGLNARSAGSAPEAGLHPEVVEAMDELDIDLRGRSPKGITEEDVHWADVVVTMGCGDACPVFPGTRYVDWELTDPIGLPVDKVRPIRDEIERRVRALADGSA
jgi:arsenate reductase (thioredoxin)